MDNTKQKQQKKKEEQTCWQKFSRIICCQSLPKYPKPYRFNFNGRDKTPENQQLFQSNYVRTSKYTPLTFFPKALILQFKRLANVYFLIIAILQTIPQISPLSPATAWAPFLVVLAISMLRQGYQDYQRIKSDHKENYQNLTEIMRDGKFKQVNWSQVVVGDIVKTTMDQFFSADLILLTSSSDDGATFIQTASLDGQKDMKHKNAVKCLIPFNTQQMLCQLKGQCLAKDPQISLIQFSAQITANGVNNSQPIRTGDDQFLYRGTKLKNTDWCYGLVYATGMNTKIMLNSKGDASKMSQIEKKVNYILAVILIIQIILSIVVSVGYSIFRRQNQSSYQYISWPTQYGVVIDSILIFFSELVLLNTMIPISLIVSIQIVKFFQKIFIERDQLLFSQIRKTKVAVKSASLNEELGQIQYIFSDKTGTLTRNLMQFKIAVIGSKMFGDIDLILPENERKKKQKQDTTQISLFKDDNLKNLLQTGAGDRPLDTTLVIKDSLGKHQLKLATQKDAAKQYIKALALAHKVAPHVNEKTQKKTFTGESPDEITLVEGARQMGYQFVKSTQYDYTLRMLGKDTSFEVMEIFKFNSDRKRMSIIVKDNGVLKLYMKGADSIIEKYTAKDNKLRLNSQLQRFSLIGLRTLLISMKLISQQQLNTFRVERQKLQSLSEKQRKQGQIKLVDKLQQNVYVIGATAILDRLQDDVPETIRDLLRANIKIWMLTGDKRETAVNIAKSCYLIQSDFQVIRFKPATYKQDDIVQYLKQLILKTDQLKQIQKRKALVIEASDLTPVLASEKASIQLANLSKNCQSVVGCRLSPSQKAEVVRVVRKHLNKITLAIGDGANDVPMIKQAHIGIGLFGEEGMSAVQASDYALPQFRMLWRILLVHGRWNYIRISQMILYFFYKNMLFTLPQFYIAFYCGFSAQTIFDDWYVALYNLAFTSIPLIIRAIFEQDVNYVLKIKGQPSEYQSVPTIKTLVKQQQLLNLQNKFKTNKYLYRLFPKIYFIGQQNCVFNVQNYLAWMFQALIQSLIIFFFTLYIISQLSVNSTGINSDYWLVSITIYSTIIMVVTFKLATHTKFWSWIYVLSIVITTIGFYILHMWLTNFTLTDYVYGTTRVAWTSLQCYFVVLLCVCIVLFVDGIILFVDFNRGGYASRMRQVIQEQKMNQKEYYDNYSISFTDNVTKNSQMVNIKNQIKQN